MRSLTSIPVVAVALGMSLLVGATSGCGDSAAGGAGDVTSTGELDPISDAFDAVRTSVTAGNAEEVCARLGSAARTQVSALGHVARDCYGGMAMLLEGLRKERRDARPPRSKVSSVKVKLTAVATVDVAGEEVRLPFVHERGRWKLDSFYGMTPRPSVAIP